MNTTWPVFQYLTQDLPDISHEELARRACVAGARWIQFRSKNSDRDAVTRSAREVRRICAEYSATCIINDHVDIACAVGADGVHLGRKDMQPGRAREKIGAAAIIGGTANTTEDIEELIAANVSYIGVGPFRHTTTKSYLSPVLGLAGCTRLIAQVAGRLPVVVIGGVVPEDVPDIIAAGADGIAVSGAAHPIVSSLSLNQFLTVCGSVNNGIHSE